MSSRTQQQAAKRCRNGPNDTCRISGIGILPSEEGVMHSNETRGMEAVI